MQELASSRFVHSRSNVLWQYSSPELDDDESCHSGAVPVSGRLNKSVRRPNGKAVCRVQGAGETRSGRGSSEGGEARSSGTTVFLQEKGNEEQSVFNAKVEESLLETEAELAGVESTPALERAKASVEEGKRLIAARQKLIRIGLSSGGEW